MRQVFTSGEQFRQLSTSATGFHRFSGHGYVQAWDTTSDVRNRGIIGASGTLSNLYVELDGAPGEGKSYTFSVVINGIASGLSVVIADNATSGNSGATTLSITAGQYISFQCTPSGTPTARSAMIWACEFVPTTVQQTFYESGGNGDFSGILVRYLFPWCGFSSYNATEATVSGLTPLNGTITAVYYGVQTNLSGSTIPVSLYKNGVEEATSANVISVGQTIRAVTGLSIDLAPGDLISARFESVEAVNYNTLRLGIQITTDTDEQFVLGGATSDPVRTDGVTEDIRFVSDEYTWSSDDSLRKSGFGVSPVYVSNFRAWVTNAPGAAGKSWTYTVQRNSANGLNVVTITNAQTTNSDDTNITTFSSDLGRYFSLSCISAGTPAAMGNNKWAAIGSTVENIKLQDPLGQGYAATRR